MVCSVLNQGDPTPKSLGSRQRECGSPGPWGAQDLGSRADGRVAKGPAQLPSALGWKQAFPSGLLTSASLPVLTRLRTHWPVSLPHLSALARAEVSARNALVGLSLAGPFHVNALRGAISTLQCNYASCSPFLLPQSVAGFLHPH